MFSLLRGNSGVLKNKRDYLGIIVFICVIVATFRIYQEYIPYLNLSRNSLRSLTFAAKEHSLSSALKSYPKIKAPFYPMVLWGMAKIGFPLPIADFLFFAVILLLIHQLFALHIKNIHWFWPMLLYGLSAFNFVNMKPYTPETLLVALSLLGVYSLFRYSRNTGVPDLIILSFCSSLLYLTRYFALFSFLPFVCFNILIINIQNVRKAVKHIASYLLLSLAPISIWMFFAYKETGYISGMDRFGARNFLPRHAHWNEFITFKHNIIFTLKTFYIDFFSPDSVGLYKTLEKPYLLRPIECIILALLLYLVLSQSRNIFIILKAKISEKERPGWLCANSPSGYLHLLFAEYFVVYITAVIIVWSVGNNDPIYTRYFYPAYPYLLFSFFCYYACVIKNGFNTLRQRLPFILLYLLYIFINCHKHIAILKSWKGLQGL